MLAMTIRLLSVDVRNKLRSGIAINNVVQCVEELVSNSLDASATCIAVNLDLTFYKIQVVDNGNGIGRSDLELIGQRHATSKCETLQDLDDTKTFGHRGEALASIIQFTQEMTIVSRTKTAQQQELTTTYVKSFGDGGTSVTVDRSQQQRPGNGTTVTILNFLYNVPVRQSLVDASQDVEATRRILETYAIVHPHVSFSLYDVGSESWRLRLPKSSSKLTTFGHVFGGNWVPLLKPIYGRREPFAVDGFVATQGYHNKNLQLLYVHRRRIVDDKLSRTINEIFEKTTDDVGSKFLSGASHSTATFSVYIIELDCPRKTYDLGFHPAKCLVQFGCFDVLEALIGEVVKRFLVEHIGDCRDLKQPTPEEEEESSTTTSVPVALANAMDITVTDYNHSLHSLAAKRPYDRQKVPCDSDQQCPGNHKEHPELHRTPTSNECRGRLQDVASSDTSQEELDPTTFLQLDHQPDLSSNSSSSSSSMALPTLFLKQKQQDRHVRSSPVPPLCVSPVIVSRPTALGKLIRDKDRDGRALKAISELHKYARDKPYHTTTTKSPSTMLSRMERKRERNASGTSRGQPSPRPTTTAAAALEVPRAFPLPTVESLFQTFEKQTSGDDPGTVPGQMLALALTDTDDVVAAADVRQLCEPVVVISEEEDDDHGGHEGNGGMVVAQDAMQPQTAISPDSSPGDVEGECGQVAAAASGRWILGGGSDGAQFYVDRNSGNSYFGLPSEEGGWHESHDAPIVSNSCLPLDSLLEAEDDHRLSTTCLPDRPWRFRGDDDDDDGLTMDIAEDQDSMAEQFRKWKNPVYEPLHLQETSSILLTTANHQSSPLEAIVKTLCQSYCFSKSILQSVKFVSQVDRKFLVCVATLSQDPDNHDFSRPNLLLLFDQHAVHERIRLEQLLEDAKYGKESEALKATVLDVPLLVKFPSKSEVSRTVLDRKETLRGYGVCAVDATTTTDAEEEEERSVVVHSLPTCLVSRINGEHDRETCRRDDILQDRAKQLMWNIAEDIASKRTSRNGFMPRIVLSVLKSQACHGAIRFGHKLTRTVCEQLLHQLCHCKLPFQCAHGRPNIAALADLNRLPRGNTQPSKPNLLRLKRLMDGD